MAIAPIAFGDDVARLVREGYEALSGKLNGRTVYRKVISDPILNTQTTKFAILDNSNKVGDIFERSVGESSSGFYKLNRDGSNKFKHCTLRGKNFFEVSESKYKNASVRDYKVELRSDTQGNIIWANYSKNLELPSSAGDKDSFISCCYNINDPSIYTWSNAEALTGRFPLVHRGLKPNDPKIKFKWNLSQMRSPNEFVDVAKNATGPNLCGHPVI